MRRDSPYPKQAARFATTRWSVVLAARRPASPEAGEALACLCRAYWYPVYAFVRRLGHRAEDAQDLTQAFFTCLLAKGSLGTADPERGRFRSFLLAAVKHFLAHERQRAAAQKRGGGRQVLSLDFQAGEDRYLREPAHERTPERLFEQRWALALLDQVVARLRQEFTAAGKVVLFDRLKPLLTGEGSTATCREAAAELDMTEGAVRVAAHRLRRRFRALLLAEIGQTVATAEEVEDELRHLFAALRPPD